MSADYQGAMPRLYGAPAYTRPPQHQELERPFDPDDLPLEAQRTEADQAVLAQGAGTAHEEEANDAAQPAFLRRSFLPFSFGGRRP